MSGVVVVLWSDFRSRCPARIRQPLTDRFCPTEVVWFARRPPRKIEKEVAMLGDSLRELRSLFEAKAHALPPSETNARRHLDEACFLLGRAIHDLEDLEKNRTDVYRDIVRAIILGGEGGAYGEARKRRPRRT